MSRGISNIHSWSYLWPCELISIICIKRVDASRDFATVIQNVSPGIEGTSVHVIHV